MIERDEHIRDTFETSRHRRRFDEVWYSIRRRGVWWTELFYDTHYRRRVNGRVNDEKERNAKTDCERDRNEYTIVGWPNDRCVRVLRQPRAVSENESNDD